MLGSVPRRGQPRDADRTRRPDEPDGALDTYGVLCVRPPTLRSSRAAPRSLGAPNAGSCISNRALPHGHKTIPLSLPLSA